MAGKRPKVKAGIRRPKREDLPEKSSDSPVEVVPMTVTPLRQHPPTEGLAKRGDARGGAGPSKRAASPTPVEVLDGEDDQPSAQAAQNPEAHRPPHVEGDDPGGSGR
ncbi:uncharacterized protein [Spinacia oleracea]|uniref:Uncharacterized protein n=1 Tax=Spinacia oleracea TaxID=3562 RepID=A0ABM3QK56_SPIOL|nr:uncharacterized protein LOC130460110 [Spinacia oleracea]